MNEMRLANENASTEAKSEEHVATNKVHNGQGTPEQTPELVDEDTSDFERKMRSALAKVTQKYAWTAQQGGIVLRYNPLKLVPMQDYVFNRVSRAQYGFRYTSSRGKKEAIWYPKAEYVLAALDEPDADFGFIMAERIAFLPGQAEVTTDADGCRVLNLWRPPAWSRG